MINITIEELKSRTYPYIGRFPDDTLVVFTKPREGYQITDSEGRLSLRYLGSWNEDICKVFQGTIILTNIV
jgi:hypothetical protein